MKFLPDHTTLHLLILRFNNQGLNQSFKLFRSTCNAIESFSPDIYLNNLELSAYRYKSEPD